MMYNFTKMSEQELQTQKEYINWVLLDTAKQGLKYLAVLIIFFAILNVVFL